MDVDETNPFIDNTEEINQTSRNEFFKNRNER